MKSRQEHLAFNLLPKEIWHLIFQLININLHDLASVPRVCVAFAEMTNELTTLVFIKHFPHLYRKFPERKKRKLTIVDLKQAYVDDYSKLPEKYKHLFTHIKDGELEKVLALTKEPLEPNFFLIQDASAGTFIRWARRKDQQDMLTHFYAKMPMPEIEYRMDLLIANSTHTTVIDRLFSAIACLQPLAEIDKLKSIVARIEVILNMRDERTLKLMLDRAATCGHFDLLNTFLPGGKYYDKQWFVASKFKWLIEAVIVAQQEAVLNFLLTLPGVDLSAVDKTVFESACNVGNSNIVLRLLNLPGARLSNLSLIRECHPDIYVLAASHPSMQTENVQNEVAMQYALIQSINFDFALALLKAPGLSFLPHNPDLIIGLALKEDPAEIGSIIRQVMRRGIEVEHIRESMQILFHKFIGVDAFTPSAMAFLMPFAIEFNVFNEELMEGFVVKLRALFIQTRKIEKDLLAPLVKNSMYVSWFLQGLLKYHIRTEVQLCAETLAYFIQHVSWEDQALRRQLLQLAAQGNFDQALQTIVAMPGVNVNVRDIEQGRTPLMNAVYYEHTQVVHTLLSLKDIDTGVTDYSGKTVFDLMHGKCLWLLNLYKYKQSILQSQESIFSQVTLFNLSARLGFYSKQQICDAVDALSAVIGGKKDLRSLDEHLDVIKSTIHLLAYYEEVCRPFSPHPKPLPQ